MGNIAGALESPRFTRLPRPSHSDAIYLPNCSSDAFITLLDWSTVKKKKLQKFLDLLLFHGLSCIVYRACWKGLVGSPLRCRHTGRHGDMEGGCSKLISAGSLHVLTL